MSHARAKKRFGQNFLVSRAIIDKIINEINPLPDDNIIEIGPGQGALTIPLVKSGANVTAVEFDRDLIPQLKRQLSSFDSVTIINQDFLSYIPEGASFKLVGNLPYNITSPVIEWAVKYRDRIQAAFLMVQKEVADRLASTHGSKDWSPIAIFSQLHFSIQKCFEVAPSHFAPAPAVKSTFVRLTPIESAHIDHYDIFERVVRTSFLHRRKTLANNLVPDIVPSQELMRELCDRFAWSLHVRAEQVATQDFLALTNYLVDNNILSD